MKNIEQKHATVYGHTEKGRRYSPRYLCAHTAPSSQYHVVFVISDYESDFECINVAESIRGLPPHLARHSIIDAENDPNRLGAQLSSLAWNRHTIIVTFGMWTTTYVAQFMGRDESSQKCLTQGAPLHLYGCSIDPMVCDTIWGSHGMRGVRNIPLSYTTLIKMLCTLRTPGTKRLFIPYSRHLFSSVHEAIWPTFTARLASVAREYGFEVVYAGIGDAVESSGVFSRAHHGDIVLTLPSSGIEPHLEHLASLCDEKRLLLCTHITGPVSYSAALCFGERQACFVPGIIDMITCYAKHANPYDLINQTIRSQTIRANPTVLQALGCDLSLLPIIDTISANGTLGDE